LSGLEEVLTCLQPTVFCDDQLSRYRGLCWSDFLQLLFKQTTDKATKVTLITGINQDRFLERTGLPSAGSRVPPSSRILTRQSTQQDYSSRLKVGDTHSFDRQQFHLTFVPLALDCCDSSAAPFIYFCINWDLTLIDKAGKSLI
jgi:hypothetical protein